MRGDGGLASPSLLEPGISSSTFHFSACATWTSRQRRYRSMAFTVREIESPDPVTRVAAEEAKLREADHDIGEKMILNMGPSHPATHGVLRLVLQLDRETITQNMPDGGVLHRRDAQNFEDKSF